ncbi:alanine racemase [Actinomyces sp. AC-20-1]|uniref:alanine racemase n=6 Tax=Actinomyces TaxID=1654 RepID=UPI002019BBEC
MRQPAATSRAVIDLDALAHNARVLAETAGTPWMAVVKADAYGHGIGPVSLTCLAAGATWLGVAQLAEALHLRDLLDRAGVSRPEPGPDAAPTPEAPRLMCWLAPVLSPQAAAAPGSPLRRALEADLDLSASTPAQLDAVAAACAAHVADGGAPGRLHLKADTGMSRAGAVLEDLPVLAAAARAAEAGGVLDVVGLWSHLSRADEPASGSTEEHLERFRRAEAVVTGAGLAPRVRHLAATGGLLWHPATRLDLVRAGIGLYGLSPDPAVATSADLGLTPVMRLEAPLTMAKRVPAGTPVSYGGTWCAPTDRWLGLVPLGYSDGVPRHAAGAGPVAVGALRTTVVGRVCMDQLVIDLGPAVDAGGRDLPCPARAGDTAVLWGAPEPTGTVPTADEWAAVCGTINYEIVTRLGPHVPRVTTSQEDQ